MLGLALLYFLAKPFYKLAERYGRNQMGYALLAIAVYIWRRFGLRPYAWYCTRTNQPRIDRRFERLLPWANLYSCRAICCLDSIQLPREAL